MYGPGSSDPKGYYLYGVLNEIEKTGIAMMQASEYIIDSQAGSMPNISDDDGQRIADNVLQTSIDELSLWQRKTTEIIVDAVGFRGTNTKDYYQHYLVLQELADLRRTQADIKEYYGAVNQNYAYQERDLIQQADRLAQKLDPNKCWYAEVKNGQIKHRLLSFERRFKAVFSKMTPQQKAVLRTQGVSFGSQSKHLHHVTSAGDKNLTLNDVNLHWGRVSILTLHAVVAAKDLMRIHNTKGFLKMCADIVKKNDYPILLHNKKTKPDIVVGDFVIAGGDLAQVTKVIRSKYGYKSFRVRFLDKPPIPSITEDEFIGELVQLYRKREPVAKDVIALLSEGGSKKPSTRRVNESIKKTILDFWANMGGKEFAYGKNDEGHKKMVSYLEAQKAKEPPQSDGSDTNNK